MPMLGLGLSLLIVTKAYAMDKSFYGHVATGINESKISSIKHEPGYLTHFTVGAGYRIIHWIDLELGLSVFDNYEYESSDFVGKYKLEINKQEVFIAPVFHWYISDSVSFFAKAGLVYSQSELEVRESFYGVKDSGSESKTDHALGYMLAIGIAPLQTKHVSLAPAIRYIQRNNFFNKSHTPYDASDIGIEIQIQLY